MIDIGINYITELGSYINQYDDVYKFLLERGYINTIKFPGKYCDYPSLQSANNLMKKTNAKIDIHGLPGMVPAIYSNEFVKTIEWEKLKEILTNKQSIKRISTHMGLKSGDRLTNYTNDELISNWNKNINNIKNKMQEWMGSKIEVGVENIPGGFDYDLKTITPEFITANWSNADFGVFDISHAKLAANDLKITYEEYLERIDFKEKVKILHVSGNINETDEIKNKPDKHTLIHKNEIGVIIKALQEFENVELVVSEYGYNTKYSYPKELVIEAITLATIVRKQDEYLSKKILNFLEENLKEDLSNLQQIVDIVQ